METNFKVKALNSDEFSQLFHLSNVELEKSGIKRIIVDSNPGFPCRVSLEDANIGEEVILLPYKHHQTNSPYQSGGPIYVRKNSTTANLRVNEIPKMLFHRLLSLRGYDVDGMMVKATVIEGENIKAEINGFFLNSKISYIHIHNAKPGCFNCSIERI